MSSPEQSTTVDAARPYRLRSSDRSHLLPERPIPIRVNKRSILGLLALSLGVAMSSSPEGLALGLPLVFAGAYLLGYPLIRSGRSN